MHILVGANGNAIYRKAPGSTKMRALHGRNFLLGSMLRSGVLV